VDFDAGRSGSRRRFRIYALERSGFQLVDFRTEEAGRGDDGFDRFIRTFKFSGRFHNPAVFGTSKQYYGHGRHDAGCGGSRDCFERSPSQRSPS
jgi:hypothetical protein